MADLTAKSFYDNKLYQDLGFDSPDTPTGGNDLGTQELAFNPREVEEICKNDVDFLAGLALPHIFKYFFPDTYIQVWNWFLSYIYKPRDFSQLALGLPRGFGKTTFVKIMLLFIILFTNRKFIVVFCENQSKANNIVSDVIDMLNELNIKRVFGDWNIGKETDRLDLKKFGFRGRNITLMAGTIETARGINLKHERPDIMLFDDIQSRVCAESQIQSETLEREMIGTAMKAKSPHGCLFIFIANMYPTKWSILRKLQQNPNWIKFIVGGILADGTSLWPELQPIEQLMQELENDVAMGHPEIFVAEVLNDPNAQANNLIDLSRLKPYPWQDDDIPGGNFVIIDPAGDKQKSDAVSVGYCEIHDEIPVLRDIVEDRLSPLDTIREAVKFCMKYNCRLVAIESTAYQASLCFWSQYLCEQMGIEGIQFVEIYPGSYSKISRILNAIKSYAKGEINIHTSCRVAVHLQITQFNPMKRDNVDGLLDLLTYMPKVIEMYGAYIVSMGLVISQEHDSAKVIEYNSPF